LFFGRQNYILKLLKLLIILRKAAIKGKPLLMPRAFRRLSLGLNYSHRYGRPRTNISEYMRTSRCSIRARLRAASLSQLGRPRELSLPAPTAAFPRRRFYKTEVHPTVVWEKFKAMRQGADLASRQH